MSTMEAVEWIQLMPLHGSVRWTSPSASDVSASTSTSNAALSTRSPTVAALKINKLPDVMLLQIFTFLPPSTLGKAAQVCRHWRNLSEDRQLWREKLRQELIKNQFVNHKLSPYLFQTKYSAPNDDDDDDLDETISENFRYLTTTVDTPSKATKQVFVKFFMKESRNKAIVAKSKTQNMFSLWKTVTSTKPKKIVLYGNGLKNPCNSRKLLQFLLGVATEEVPTDFKVTGMISKGSTGVIPILDFLLNGRSGILGAWISLELKSHDFTLVIICEANSERSTVGDGLLVRNDAFISSSPPLTAGPSQLSPWKLSPKFQELFDDADGFVCVIDAGKIHNSATFSRSANPTPSYVTTPSNANTPSDATTPSNDGTPSDTTASSNDTTSQRNKTSLLASTTYDWEEELSILSKHCCSSKLRMKAAPLLVLPLMEPKPTDEWGRAQSSTGSLFQAVKVLNDKRLMTGRPWQVNGINLSTMDGVSLGFEWILKQKR